MIPKTGVCYRWAAQRYVLLSATAIPLEARAVALDPDQARWTLAGLRGQRGEVIALLVETGASIRTWRDLDADALLRQVQRRVEGQRLVVLHEESLGDETARSELSASPERLIVRAVMGGERLIRFQDQQLILLQVSNWPWLRDELDLQVVPRNEAVVLLDRMASASGSQLDRQQATRDAKGLLVERIQPGITAGLVLARRAPGRTFQATAEEVAAVAPRPKTAPAPEVPPLTIVLQHLYHDDGPIQGAEYVLTFPGGQVIKGKLDASGMAVVNDVPADTADVIYGPDSRDFKPVDQTKNPSFKQTLSPVQSDAIAQKYWRQSNDDHDDDGNDDDGGDGDSSDDGGDEA